MEVAGGFAPLVGDTGGGEERPDGGNTYLRRQRFGSCDTNQGGGGSEDRSGTPTAEEKPFRKLRGFFVLCKSAINFKWGQQLY